MDPKQQTQPTSPDNALAVAATMAFYAAAAISTGSTSWDDDTAENRGAMVIAMGVAMRKAPTARQMHAMWCARKQAGGWAYGETLDEASKTHPMMCPYDSLPDQEKLRGRLFVAIARAFGGSL
jgi:hypothetical protein